MVETRMTKPAGDSQQVAPLRLEFLDGIRGLAAAYVALHHAYLSLGRQGNEVGLSPLSVLATNWLAFGGASVAVFIVLSGFCLMLPLARRNTLHLPNGILNFIVRRGWRILPPYYAAMALSLVLIAAFPAFGRKSGSLWDDCLPAFNPWVILSHLFLFHNLSYSWIFKIDYPMWSVSTEWQIYFVFALMLLPAMRRCGMLVGLGLAFALGFALDRYFGWAHFHFIGLFALGMAAAQLLYSESPNLLRLRNRMPWGLLTGALGIAFLIMNCKGLAWEVAHATQSDILCGLASTSAIIYLARIGIGSQADPIGTQIRKLLESKLSVGLGTISYSLYLVHAIVIAAVVGFLAKMTLAPEPRLWSTILVATPCILGASWIFYRLFEKPAIEYRARVSPGRSKA